MVCGMVTAFSASRGEVLESTETAKPAGELVSGRLVCYEPLNAAYLNFSVSTSSWYRWLIWLLSKTEMPKL
jgi:hypothetical protein